MWCTRINNIKLEKAIENKKSVLNAESTTLVPIRAHAFKASGSAPEHQARMHGFRYEGGAGSKTSLSKAYKCPCNG
jgi:hypothetical protein